MPDKEIVTSIDFLEKIVKNVNGSIINDGPIFFRSKHITPNTSPQIVQLAVQNSRLFGALSLVYERLQLLPEVFTADNDESC